MSASDEQRVSDLAKKVEESEKQLTELKLAVEKLPQPNFTSETHERIYNVALGLGLSKFCMKRAPSDYYEWTLERRRNFLGAASIHQLCKTIILENTRGTATDCSNKLNSRFYAVIVQYTSRLQTAQLEKFVRSLIPGASRSNYHLRSAKPEDVALLTGAEFNGVCPIGNKTDIPIVLSERLLHVPTGWMFVGGGEPELKLGFSVQEFIQQTGCFVGDIAEDGMTTDDATPIAEAASPAPADHQS